ncbi:hypothetical protein JDV02_003032 [Purpureocillium takamizusanense]|uniref:Uncharacterized protein n=1 Tax=Purpureocillium takamizusanense TaxID=2060973 RepID=A0A9Q8QBK8_9HYPO|nr:uncharacterized protein JDV02_003032 [Purpureocillium takamizusanense]UNI16605.1 hypothetical protein JDV02_003032 [Purpureocillium takamizusanense]
MGRVASSRHHERCGKRAPCLSGPSQGLPDGRRVKPPGPGSAIASPTSSTTTSTHHHHCHHHPQIISHALLQGPPLQSNNKHAPYSSSYSSPFCEVPSAAQKEGRIGEEKK